MNEIWKDILGYEGHFSISNYGKIKSYDRYIKHPRGGLKFQKGLDIKTNTDSHGYKMVRLVMDKKGKTYRVHRLVMLTFIGKSDLFVDHINNIPNDNRLENLRYVTPKENVHHYKRFLNKNWEKKQKLEKKEKFMLLPKNITYRKDTKRYSIRITIDNRYKSMGSYKTLEEAKLKINKLKNT